MAKIEYTNQQRAEYLEVAAEIGITRAKRQLGYPASWGTAQRWVQAAGIEVPLDEIKSQAAAFYDWYKTEDLLIVVQEGLRRAQESLANSKDLSADDQKKLSEAVQKYSNTYLLLLGKANSITESRKVDTADLELVDLLNEEKARNSRLEEKGAESLQDLDTPQA